MMTTEVTTPLPQKGDFFVSSWGYDQTNIDYYQVVGVTPSGKSVRVRKVAHRSVGSTGYSDSVVPVKGAFIGPVKTKRLSPGWRGGWAIHLTSYSSGFSWDGTPHSETDSRFGH